MDKRLLALLVCPVCKGELRHDRKVAELLCLAEGLAYPIRDGVPIMLRSEARQMSLAERDAAR